MPPRWRPVQALRPGQRRSRCLLARAQCWLRLEQKQREQRRRALAWPEQLMAQARFRRLQARVVPMVRFLPQRVRAMPVVCFLPQGARAVPVARFLPQQVRAMPVARFRPETQPAHRRAWRTLRLPQARLV